MKEFDLARFAELIYSAGEISRAELAEKTNLVPSYISSIVRRLQDKGWILEGSHVPSGRGRRRVRLYLNPDLAHLIGIEIGRVNTRIVVSDFLGHVLSFKKVPSEVSRGEQFLLGAIHQEIRRCLSQDDKIRAIGVAHSGVIDHVSGTVLFWPRVEGWHEVPLEKILENEYGLTVVVEDSVRTAAMAEQRFGLGRGKGDFAYVDAGVGIGSAIFVDGRLYFGRNGLAGELGHTTIDEDGELCSCGNRGCLEIYASGAAVVSHVRHGLEQGVASSLAELRGDNFANLSLEMIAQAAAGDDRLCASMLEEAGTHLGTALASMVNLLNPERIVLGGALPRVAKASLLDPLLRSLKSRAFPGSVSQLEVVVSELGEEGAAVGACLLVATRIIQDLCKDKTEAPSPHTADSPGGVGADSLIEVPNRRAEF
jgi:predicted NBD/HSP70 family sugar kinase